MKRFLITALLIVVIIGVMLHFIPQSMRDDVYGYAQYNPVVSIYCRNADCAAVDMGLGYQVSCSIADFDKVLSLCGSVDGVSVRFDGTLSDVNAIVARLHAVNVNCQQLDDLFVACYYSPLIRERVTIDNRLVNVQIAYRDGTITVGYPLILGSY